MSDFHILSVDIGTSAIRAGLFDSQANPLPETLVSQSHDLKQVEGGAVFDADTSHSGFVSVLDRLESRLSPETSPKLAGISAFWHSILGIDVNGEPVTPVFSWAETRSAAAVPQLQNLFDETEIHHRTGCRFHASYWPAKLLWLASEYPEQYRNAAKWVSLADYVWLKLFGRLETGVSMASGTGIFDIRKNCWDREILRGLEIDEERLPEIADAGEPRTLAPEHGSRWPRLASTGWFPAVGDGAANNLGAGAVTANACALMIGTSGAVRVAYEGAVPAKVPEGLFCYCVDEKMPVIGGAVSDGGNLILRLKGLLGISADDDPESRILEREPDKHGLTFLPFLYGERSTGFHTDAGGALLGITSATTRVDILQAAMEAVGFRLSAVLDLLDSVFEIERIVVSGGALQNSPAWTRIVADILGRDLAVAVEGETSLKGAAVFAIKAGGLAAGSQEDFEDRFTVVESNPENHRRYVSAKKRHEEAYRRLMSMPA